MIFPPRGFRNPLTVLRVVDLPDPLPPSNATMSPCGTDRLTPRKTSVGPYETRKSSMASTGALLPEIRLDDCRILPDPLRGSLGDLLAVVEDCHPVRDAHHESDDMLDEDDGNPLLGPDPTEELVYAGHPGEAEAGRRFVEEKEPWLPDEGTGNLDEPLLAI